MQLLLVLAIVAAVSISEYAPRQPVPDIGTHMLWAIVAMAVAPLFAVAASSVIAGSLRRDSTRKRELLRWFNQLRGLHSLLWFIVAGVVLQQLGWVRMVRFNWHLDRFFLLDDVLIFLPVIVPLVLSWAAFYEVERSLRLTDVGNNSSTNATVTRSQYVGLHVRHYLGLMLLPVLTVLAAQDLVQYLGPSMPGDTEAWILLAPVIGLLVFFPVVLRRIWRTEPLADGEFRDELIALSQRVGLPTNKLFIWRTDRMIVNAAVTGLVRPWRYVFFTDVLLSRFSTDEVKVVLGHEIGHVRRHHLLYRIVLIAIPVVLWLVFAKTFPAAVQSCSDWIAAWGLSVGAQTAIAGPVGLGLYAATIFAWHSRVLEYDADLFAARACDIGSRLTSEGCHRVIALLEKLSLVGGIERHARSWLHPTIANRIELLERTAADVRIGERCERRARSLHRSMFAVAVSAIAYLAITLS